MITIRRAVLKRCPHRDETDRGELVIVLPGDAPELHQLAAMVDGLCDRTVSHEDFTRNVLALLPVGAQVTTTWRTGPWLVEVSEGALLREPVNTGGA